MRVAELFLLHLMLLSLIAAEDMRRDMTPCMHTLLCRSLGNRISHSSGILSQESESTLSALFWKNMVRLQGK